MIVAVHRGRVQSSRVGLAFRTLRLRRGWRQSDLAERAGLSRWQIGRVERDDISSSSVGTLEAMARALGAEVHVSVRWHGAEIDRLVNLRHATLHEAMARRMAREPGWEIAAEVSFSVYGERGVIDILAFHRPTGALLVIELKSELVDVQEVVGTFDRKLRLAERVARERGWQPRFVGGWVVLTEGRTNRRHVDGHQAILRGTFPADGHAMTSWLKRPAGPIRALSFVSVEREALRDQLPVARRRASRAGRPALAPRDTVR